MTGFWKMLVGPTPGERVNACASEWINGVEDKRPAPPARPTAPPSDAAAKIASAIEASQGRWAFEDDQGHSHCYGLGITVSHGPKAIVWQGARDEHVSRYYSDQTMLFEADAHSADAVAILGALKRRRTRYDEEAKEAARRAAEERKAAQAKRAEEAIEKLARGECLEDPLRRRQAGPMLGGISNGLSSAGSRRDADRYSQAILNAYRGII